MGCAQAPSADAEVAYYEIEENALYLATLERARRLKQEQSAAEKRN